MDGRVVEGDGLENRFTRNRNVGSNPSPSVLLFYSFAFALSGLFLEVGRCGFFSAFE